MWYDYFRILAFSVVANHYPQASSRLRVWASSPLVPCLHFVSHPINPNRDCSPYRGCVGIYKIWHYKRETTRRRKEVGLPELFDPDDLPDPQYDPNFVHVLTNEEHKDLHRRTLPIPGLPLPRVHNCSFTEQIKFAYHETWYRPHGTETHRVS